MKIWFKVWCPYYGEDEDHAEEVLASAPDLAAEDFVDDMMRQDPAVTDTCIGGVQVCVRDPDVPDVLTYLVEAQVCTSCVSTRIDT